VDGDTAIGGADRLAPARALPGQIALGEEASVLARPPGHLAGGLALVEAGPPDAQALEGAREVRVDEPPPDRRPAPLGQEDARRGGSAASTSALRSIHSEIRRVIGNPSRA
jgi:hypothetical protein